METLNTFDWNLQEMVELLRNFYVIGYDFHQIANKLKEKNETFCRQKNFYTSQLCESVLQKFLKSTKDKPMIKEYFGDDDHYNERMHAKEMFEYLENYNKNVLGFFQKLSTNEKYKNLLFEYKKGNLSDEFKDKLAPIIHKFPELSKLALTTEEYERSLKTQNVCEKLLANRKVESYKKLEVLLKEKMEEIEHQERLNAEAPPPTVGPGVTPKPSQTPSQAISSSSKALKRDNESKSSSSNKPGSADTPSKRRKVKYLTPKEEIPLPSKSSTNMETPIIKKKRRPSTASQKSLSTIKLSSPFDELKPGDKKTPIISKSKLSLNIRAEKKSVKTCEAESQTYLCLTTKLTDLAPPLPALKPKEEFNSTGPKRTVSCQTGPVRFSSIDVNNVWWIDDGNEPNLFTSTVASEGLRSYDENISKEKCLITVIAKEQNLVDPFTLRLRETPLFKSISEIRKADQDCFFHFPVKYEVENYSDHVNHPMDIVTIEDLTIKDKVKDLIDLELCTAHTAANAVYFNRIPKEAEDFAKRTSEILDELIPR